MWQQFVAELVVDEKRTERKDLMCAGRRYVVCCVAARAVLGEDLARLGLRDEPVSRRAVLNTLALES